MKWLLKRLTIVCLTMGVLCAAAVALGRLDHSPSKLQVLGLDFCDGEPCFRGIKLKTEWSMVKQRFSQGVEKETYLDVPTNSPDIQEILIHSGTDRLVDSIQLTNDLSQPFPFNVGDVVAQYGAPCLVVRGDIPEDMIIIYPKMTIRTLLFSNSEDSDNHLLQLKSPVWDIEIASLTGWGTCKDKISEDYGPWRGFITSESYLQRNRTDMNLPLSVNP